MRNQRVDCRDQSACGTRNPFDRSTGPVRKSLRHWTCLFAGCLRDGGSCDDAAQLAAARQLVCTTLYGAFRLDSLSGLQAGHQILIVQWQHGIRCVVWPPEQAERPLLLPLTE